MLLQTLIPLIGCRSAGVNECISIYLRGNEGELIKKRVLFFVMEGEIEYNESE